MKVALIFKGGAKNASGAPPDQKLMAEVGKFLAGLKVRGIMLDGFGLKPPAASRSDQEMTVMDGAQSPRPENLNPAEHGTVEIREIYEPADYGEGFVKALNEVASD